jgi:hypothetical protein
VIKVGDALFGSTVAYLDMGNAALNDVGQFAFSYRLANNVSGIAVANNVPEPGSTALLGLCALGLLDRRRRA